MSSAQPPSRSRPLGAAQLYVLQMCTPEWPTRHPDARAARVLRSLEARGLVYENRGRWYASDAGRAAVEAAQTLNTPSPTQA